VIHLDEFVEGILRLSTLIFKDSSPKNISHRAKLMMQEFVVPFCELIKRDTHFVAEAYDPVSESFEVMRQYRRGIKRAYKHWSGGDEVHSILDQTL